MKAPEGSAFDAQGRCLYVGDRVRMTVAEGIWPPIEEIRHDGYIRFEDCQWWMIVNETITVDLTMSPPHTNQERYFPEFSYRELAELTEQICDENPDHLAGCIDSCPFEDWYTIAARGVCRAAFLCWLEQVALR